MSNQQFLANFYTEKKIFTSKECDSIVKYMTELQQTVYTVKIDGKYIEEGCSLKSQDLEYNENTKWIYDKVKSYISNNVECEWIGEPHGIFRKYSIDDFFVKHKDNVDKIEADKRYLTVSIQLTSSDNYLGGNVIINEETYLSRNIGNTIMWGINVPHEVTKIKKGFRNALVFFVSTKHLKLVKKLF